MDRRKFFIVMYLLMAMAVIPWGDGQVRAQSNATVEISAGAVAAQLGNRADQMRERRIKRVTQAQREAAAARAKAARTNAAPEKDGKGDAK